MYQFSESLNIPNFRTAVPHPVERTARYERVGERRWESPRSHAAHTSVLLVAIP